MIYPWACSFLEAPGTLLSICFTTLLINLLPKYQPASVSPWTPNPKRFKVNITHSFKVRATFCIDVHNLIQRSFEFIETFLSEERHGGSERLRNPQLSKGSPTSTPHACGRIDQVTPPHGAFFNTLPSVLGQMLAGVPDQ